MPYLVTPIRHAPGVTEPCDRCPDPSAFWVSTKTPAKLNLGFVLGEPLKLCVARTDTEVGTTA